MYLSLQEFQWTNWWNTKAKWDGRTILWPAKGYFVCLKSIDSSLWWRKSTYCGTINGAAKGLEWLLSLIWPTFGKTLLNGLYWFDVNDEIPSKCKTSWPVQYFVWYFSVPRWIWKHSENPPNSKKFPSNNPDGNFPHASITIFVIRVFSQLFSSYFV